MLPNRSTAARTAASASARDVQLYGQQVVRLSHRLSHGVGIPASGDDRVTGRQRGFGEINAHATASSGNKPSLLLTHDISLVLLFKTLS